MYESSVKVEINRYYEHFFTVVYKAWVFQFPDLQHLNDYRIRSCLSSHKEVFPQHITIFCD